MIRRPLSVLLTFFIGGIITAFYYDGRYLLYLSILLSSVSLSFTLLKMIKREPCIYAPLILYFCLGYLIFYPHATFHKRSDNILRFAETGKRKISGVISDLTDRENRMVALLENIMVEKTKVRGKLRISVGGITDIKKGDEVIFVSEIRKIRNYSNEGCFNYRQFLNFSDIYARTYVNWKTIKVVKRGKNGIFDKLRSEISMLIERSTGTSESKAILKTLVTGDRNIPPELRDIFNRTGTGHILAVSGLHMGIIASLIFYVSAFFLSYMKPVLISGKLKRYSALFTVPGVLFYGILAGMSPSTQRAIIMVLIFVLSLQLKKESDLFNIILAAAMVILIYDPRSLFFISFQLSFSAVFFIMISLKFNIHKKYTSKFYHRIASFAFVTFFATLGTIPIVMHYFYQVSLVGIFANLLIIPLFSLIILPLGLTAALTGLFSKVTGIFLFDMDLNVLNFAVGLIRNISDFKYSAIITVRPDIFEISLLYIIIFSVFMSITGKNRRRSFLILAFASVIFLFDCSYWIYQRYLRDDMRVTFLDVGQGNSTLLELPGGKTVLIDGGGFSSNMYFDMGKFVLAPFLLSKKILTIDTMILSHPNSDHMNGLIYIAENFNVKSLWSNADASDTMSYKFLLKALNDNGISHEICYSPKKEIAQNTVFEVLYPFKSTLNLKRASKNSNKNSLVIKVGFGEFSFLFPGDIEKDSEKELLRTTDSALKSTILLVPHHGSNTSSSIEFIKAVSPEIAVISAGYRNRFRFPDKKVVEKLVMNGAKVLRIDKAGSVIFTIGKESYGYRLYNNN